MNAIDKARLIVAVSSRALFDLEDANRIFETEGVDAYRRHQAASRELPRPGAAFPIVQALANAGAKAGAPVEVIVVSRNTPETGVRIVQAIEDAGLGVARGVFTGGAPSLVPYLEAFGAQLFLTKSAPDAAEASAAGVPAALMYDPPAGFDPDADQVRIAFDGDSCLFSDESDQIYHREGMAAFMAHERAHAGRPLPPGPLAPFLRAIHDFQEAAPGHRLFRIALVTARIGAARERAIRTLTDWGIRVDEAFFCGDDPKAKFISLFRPHIFFDDKDYHLELTSKVAPSARVPSADPDDPGLARGMKP
jgi:5'-nucleotidase